MIPEWVSFRNEFCSRMNFVLHSHDKIDRLSHLEKDTFARHLENDTRAPLAPDLHGFRFHLGTEFVFSLRDTRMKCHTRTRISFGLKTGVNSFRNDLCGNEISSRYHVNRYKEIYGYGMNSFWNESHSGIMWTAPKYGITSRRIADKCTTPSFWMSTNWWIFCSKYTNLLSKC